MNKKDFLRKLRLNLFSISHDEREKAIAYYEEMIDDAIDDGMSEEDAVASMGSIQDAVRNIKDDATARGKRVRKIGPWGIALLILGFPLWFPLLVAFGCVLLGIYCTAWGVIISFVATAIGLTLCIIPGIVALVVLFLVHPMAGLFAFGAGLICTAIGLLLIYPVALVVKWGAVFTVNSFKAIFCGFPRKAV